MNKIIVNETSLTIEEAFNDFINYKKSINLSPESIAYYEECYRYFWKFYDIELPVNTITQAVYIQYRKHLLDIMSNSISINTRLRGIKVIFNYFIKMGYTEPFKIELIKQNRKYYYNTYTLKELEILLKKPNMKKCSFAEYRTWVMIMYTFSNGHRLKTIRNIKNEDIDFDNGVIHARTVKNRIAMNTPMSDTLAKTLKEYMKIRGGKPNDYLFCTQNR